MGNRVNDRDIPNMEKLYEALKSDNCEGYDLIKVRNMITLIQFLASVVKTEEK